MQEKKEAIDMDIQGFANSIVSKADKFGGLLGFFTGSMHGFGDVLSSIENALQGNVHFPDLIEAVNSYAHEPFVKNAILAYIIGYIAKEVNIPVIGKYGGAIEKGAMGYAAGSFIQKLLWSSTHSGEHRTPASIPTSFRGAGYNPWE